MKHIMISMAIISSLMIGNSIVVKAQDMMKTDPKISTVLVDTTIMRAMITTFQPGQKTESHTHPAHFYYAMTDGKLKVHYGDGTSEVYDIKSGEAFFGGPEKPHRSENVGDKPMKFLLVEFKEHPYKPGKK